MLPFANAKMMNLHLAEISARVAPGVHAVLIVDGAGWHRFGVKLCIPDHTTLLHLPPWSRELNPAENFQTFLRGNKLNNRVFDSIEAIVDACCDPWNWFMAQPDRIASTGTSNRAQVSR